MTFEPIGCGVEWYFNPFFNPCWVSRDRVGVEIVSQGGCKAARDAFRFRSPPEQQKLLKPFLGAFWADMSEFGRRFGCGPPSGVSRGRNPVTAIVGEALVLIVHFRLFDNIKRTGQFEIDH